MCHELHSTYKCSCVIVRPTFCTDSIKRTLCDVVSIEQKHLSLTCSRCRQRALEKLKNLAAAAPVKQNLAIANATALFPTSNNKRKATPELEQDQDQERTTTKKPKTQTQAEAKVEREKRLEYQRKYRQAQAAKKRAAEREKVEAQRQREDEELEEGILAAFEEIV